MHSRTIYILEYRPEQGLSLASYKQLSECLRINISLLETIRTATIFFISAILYESIFLILSKSVAKSI